MTVILTSGRPLKHELKETAEKSGVFEGLFYLDQSPVRVEVVNGKITRVTRIKSLSEKNKNLYIGPGLIDNQVNGYIGVSFSLGDLPFTKEDAIKVTKELWKAGVTTYLPTLRTNSQENLLKNLSILAKAKADTATKGSIAGYHLEGPYISKENGYRGAHALEYVRKADWASFMKLYEASDNNILQVTLAPEAEGAMDFIAKCKEKNIVIGLGHHNASAALVKEAIDKGARIATHLGNALANTINRHENPLWSQLSDDRLMISIIGDGFHLLPEEIRVFYKVKGPLKTIITSDVDRYAGMEPGKYLNSEGDTIQLTTDGAVIYLARNSLSGSASPVTRGVANVMKVTGCTMAEAFQMGSTNAAALYSLRDRGAIREGLRADLVLFTIENSKINIKKTVVGGTVVYEANESKQHVSY
ncbi:N-acetylglucosamine-6-phosphate deacetylase [Flavitalea sp.]|nr:amidohydrolase family protein [Flavitalea sp.]